MAAALVVGGCESSDSSEGQAPMAVTRQGLVTLPDFVVTAVKGPASAMPGQPSTVQVTVCNQGTQGDSTEVELYLSADETIRRPVPPAPPEDSLLGSTYLPWLEAGQCTTQSLNVSAYVPPPGGDGPYWLGAVVDPYGYRPELNEDNNALAGQRMGVGYAPDFVVTAVKGPASATPGQRFNATVTVCNQGTQGGGAHMELYLSADELIRSHAPPDPMEDAPLGAVSVPWLEPGLCTTLTPEVGAYLLPQQTEGAYWLGALVDPYSTYPELIEDNNALAGQRMGVGYRPDFVVTAVKGPASVQSGQSFTAQVTVCNQGTQGDSTEVELYLSADEFIRRPVPPGPMEDAPLGVVSLPWLEMGQCTTQALNVSAYVPPPGGDGPYWLGAVVDPYASRLELIEDNNALAGQRMGVGYGPDFVVTAVQGPASAMPGQAFTAQVTVCNQGTQGDSTEVELYLSADETIRRPVPPGPMEDMPLGATYLPWLEAGQCTTQALSVSAYVPPPGGDGPYWLGALVDPYANRLELIEDNNALAGSRMGVGYGPDFVVTAVKGPASVQSGQAFTAQVTVCNQGTQGDSTEVELYLSADETIRRPVPPGPMEDMPLGATYLPWLEAGQCTTQALNVSAYVPPPGGDGPYWLGALVDPYANRLELIEDNNALAGQRMGVGYRPDFVVTAVKGPSSVQSGQALTAQVTVCNQGTQGDPVDVEVYLSADEFIRRPVPPGPMEDMPLGMLSLPRLEPGQCATQSLSANAYLPPGGVEGPYWLGAVVDPYGYKPELIEDNNALAGQRLGVGYRPDFVVTAVTGPVSATPGQPFTAQVTVCNQGTRGDSTEVELYLSADATIRPPLPPGPMEDAPLGVVSLPWLEAGQCTTQSLSVSAYLPPPGNDGPYWLGAVVDPYSSRLELLEDNNALAGSRMGVGYGPDFLITSVTSLTSAQLGQSISVSARVCNYGRVSGSTNVELYLSADTTVTRGGEDFLLGTVSSGTLSPGACATRSATVPASAPSQGAWYLAALADPTNTQPELIEDNNALAGNRIGLGSGADFIINSVSVPANAVRPGQAFSTSVSVCNRGTAAGSTEVALYLSPDTTIAVPTPSAPAEDFQVGSFTTVTLNAGACTSQSVTVAANVPREGTWYLGAIADPTNTRPELIEDNNARASSRLGVGHLADFTFTALSGPTTATRNQPYTASFTVCNRGTVADSVEVELYFSADSTISPPAPWQPSSDLPQGLLSVGPLNPATCTTRSFTLNVSVPSTGSWYLGIAADPYRSRNELFEDNNTRSGTLVSVAP